MSLLLGLGLGAAPSVAHHYGLMAIRFLRPKSDDRSQAAIVAMFLGPLTLHSLRYSHLLLSTGCCWAGALGSLSGNFDATWHGLIYFSGIDSASLGYTQIKTSGPIRIINMMQSLGGALVLTWTATFLYSVCEQAWSKQPPRRPILTGCTGAD